MSITKTLTKNILPKESYNKIWRRGNWKKYAERFDSALQYYVIEKGLAADANEVEKWRQKLVDAFVNDNWFPDEYFFFNYERLSCKGRHEFVPNREAAKYWDFMNTHEVYRLTCDKGQTYEHFKPYFHRDLISISSQSDFDDFGIFVKKHPKFIVKPTFGNLGNGVQVIDTNNDNEETIIALFKKLLVEYSQGFIVEELIVQCAELSAFHPSSVNTVRLTTARQSNGDIYIIHRPFIRLGQGGRCVDNGGNGGIIAAIDYDTGIIKGAIDERMNRYVVHPDSGKIILGYQIPQWKEALNFVLELANVLPELRYCGWDLALTEKGWVMVEANGKGLFIGFQMPTQEGFREEFERIKKECGYKE